MMPINRSIAINALLPSFLPRVSEETNITPVIKQATNTTATQRHKEYQEVISVCILVYNEN